MCQYSSLQALFLQAVYENKPDFLIVSNFFSVLCPNSIAGEMIRRGRKQNENKHGLASSRLCISC